MAEQHDVVIIGSRLVGASLAARLAAEGVEVAVLERHDDFRRDVLPCQVVQADVFAFLDRLGVMKEVEAELGPYMNRLDARFGDLRFVSEISLRDGDPGAAAFAYHASLTPIVAARASALGADVRLSTKVTGLLVEDGRLAGVRASQDGVETELRARLVVGADGRSSTIARLVNARKYDVTRSERAYLWGYFDHPDLGGSPAFVTHRWADRFYWAGPTPRDQYMAGISFDVARLTSFRRSLVGSYLGHVMECEPLAAVLRDASLVSPPRQVVRIEGYFREAAGPGWVLVGDAGHFKDPLTGRGVGDGFMQVDALVPVILDGLAGPLARLDKLLARWARRRDRQFAEHYWLAADLADLRPLPSPVIEVFRTLHRKGDMHGLLGLLNHRSQPSEVVTPLRAVAATARLLRAGTDPRHAVGDLTRLTRQELSRRARRWRPVYQQEASRRGDG